MSLLRQIQNDAASDTVPVSVVLRKCKILAARLKNNDFAQWVNLELNGYPRETEVPSYRVFKNAEMRGDFQGPFNSGFRNIPVPSRALPPEFQDAAKQDIRLPQSCSYYEDLIKPSPNSDKDNTLRLFWSSDVVAMLANYTLGICPGHDCIQLWWTMPRGIIVILLESVRDKILSFALDIEKENPEAGDIMGNEPPIEEKKVQQIYNQNFHAPVANVASGSQNFSQEATIETHSPNQNLNIDALRQELPSLREALKKEAATTEQYLAIAEVSKVLDEVEKPETEQDHAKIRTGLTNAGKWTFDVATKIGAAVVADQIKQYMLQHGIHIM